MGLSPISDLTVQTLQTAMRGVGQRRQAYQDNIANAETPGYLANRVSFEDSLASAMQQGRSRRHRHHHRAAPAIPPTSAATTSRSTRSWSG